MTTLVVLPNVDRDEWGKLVRARLEQGEYLSPRGVNCEVGVVGEGVVLAVVGDDHVEMTPAETETLAALLWTATSVALARRKGTP